MTARSRLQQQAREENWFAQRLEHEVDAATLAKHLADGSNDRIILDLRKPEEFAQAHVPSAHNVPLDEVVDFARGFPEGTRFITYCYHIGCLLGTRAAARLAEEGFAVQDLLGGWKTWKELGHPTERGEQRNPAPRAAL